MARLSQTILDRVDRGLASHRPSVLASLQPPATAEEIAGLESRFNRRLMSEIRDLYMWHNGSSDITEAFFPGDDFVFLPVAESATEYTTMNQVINETFADPRDAGQLWQASWLPIGSSYAGSLLVVDHAPGETFGQVFPVEHGNGGRPDRGWPDLASTLAELLDELAAETP